MFIVAQLLPILPDSFHIWSLLVFLQKCTLQKPEGQSEGGGQRKEIQHEGKGVETIRKATKRGRKRGQGKKIITGGKKNSQLSSTFPGRDRGSRGETAHKSQVFLFFLPPPSSSSSFLGGQRTACYKSISRSNYGTAPILQDACRSVQPQPLLHLFCHIYRLCLCVDVTSHVIDLLTVMCKVRAHSTRQSVSSFPPPPFAV